MARESNGGALAKMRSDRGLTQEAVAKRIGVTHSTLSRLESGSRRPSFSVLCLLGEEYGVTDGAVMAAFREAIGRRRARRNGRKVA
jgi:transcriptional regulator with XRE-family HTH domain